MLEYVRLHPERLSATHPTVLLLSPWVPGNTYLPYVPEYLINNEHNILPSLLPAMDMLGSLVSGGVSLLSAMSAPPLPESEPKHVAVGAPQRRLLKHQYPETYKLLLQYMWAEEQQGISQEHLLCLGKGVKGEGTTQVGSREWMRATIESFRPLPTDGERPVRYWVRVYWGAEDAMVPQDARGTCRICELMSRI
jgi:hypothetical protein